MKPISIVILLASILYSLAFCESGASSFDTFIFKDGKKRHGTLREERADGFEIRTSTGRVIFVAKEKIEKIIDAFGVTVYPKSAGAPEAQEKLPSKVLKARRSGPT